VRKVRVRVGIRISIRIRVNFSFSDKVGIGLPNVTFMTTYVAYMTVCAYIIHSHYTSKHICRHV